MDLMRINKEYNSFIANHVRWLLDLRVEVFIRSPKGGDNGKGPLCSL